MNSRGMICLFLLVCFGFCAYAEGDLLGTGVDYTVLPNQTLYGGLCAQGRAEGGGIEILSAQADMLPRLYGASGETSARGIYARTGESEIFLTPDAPNTPVLLDFLMIDSGAQADIRLWSSDGETGIGCDGNPCYVISQRPAENGDTVTCITRSITDGSIASGDSCVYLSRETVLSVTGQAQFLTINPPRDAALLATAKWTFDACTQSLTVSASENGSSSGISYYAFVGDIIVMSGRNTEKASGTIKSDGVGNEWRLRIVLPEAGIIQSPLYRMDASLFRLTDGRNYLTQLPDETPTATDTPAPSVTIAPKTATTFSGSSALTLPDPDHPYELTRSSCLFFSSQDLPEVQITVDDLRFQVNIGRLPDGYTLKSVTFKQTPNAGIVGFIANDFQSDFVCAANPVNSTVSLTLTMVSSDNTPCTVNAGVFTVKVS